MSDGMAYLLRPVHAGFMSLEAIHRTDLDLNDFADANEFLDIQHENQARMSRWAEARTKRAK